ncbi:MAG TPA: ATP-binding protein [Chlamydiales bacterium]|nr:ATP-binding protein [Chlamydiales bacterium]
MKDRKKLSKIEDPVCRYPLNPFQFGNPVEGEYYLDRPELSGTLSQFLSNRSHVVLIGPRRFGKTSFVLNLLKEFEEESYICVFVDIFNITSLRDFLQQMLRALNLKKSIWSKFLQSFSQYRPKISADVDSYSGQPTFGMTIDKANEKDIKDAVQDLFLEISKLGNRVIIAIDEFQKISQIEDKGWLEATLRTFMQQLKNTSFLLTGSRKSIVYDMLNNSTRPLYRSAQIIEFPSFGAEFTDWVIDRFRKSNIKCDKKPINLLRKMVQDTPNYVQMICFHLVAEGKTHVTGEEVENVLKKVARQNAYAYQTLLNTLSLTQQRSLRLAAKEGKQLFSKHLLEKYEIASGAALSSALKALKEKGILDEEETYRGSVAFDDPLFSFWLKSTIN